MNILTAEEMSAVDRRTAEDFGVPLKSLMEHAGNAVATFCLRQYGSESRTVVLCGKGNNGGDGFVAARRLAQSGWSVRVVLLGRMEDVVGEAPVALQRLRDEASGVIVDEVVEEAALKACAPLLRDAELLIDAVVGTGFKPPLRGLAVLLREMVEGLGTPIVAVDLPSGWDANSMEQTADGAFRADAVVTFTAPKRAHMFGHVTKDWRNVWSGGGGGDRVAAAGGGLGRWADLDRRVEGAGGEAARRELE